MRKEKERQARKIEEIKLRKLDKTKHQ